MKVLKLNLKRILVILMIFVTLMFFLAEAGRGVQAKSKLPNEGEFYYSGTTKGTYTVTQGIFDWLLENLGAIVDWLIGMATMLIRMVFVGWTALIEMLLTWVLETTMNMEVGIGSVNATNVSSNTDSTQNVTVEAIVFGLVPIFDINIFNLEYPKTTATGIDLFNQQCTTCEKIIPECTCNAGTADSKKCICSACEMKRENADLLAAYKMTCTNCGKGINECLCNTTSGAETCSCDLCNFKGKNTVLKVKQTVAEWYYIIRLIAIIAMLIVLLGVGIKMLTTSIASDKALYKRMLTDWVVGMIILFTIHYMMIIIININDSLVKVIREASISSVVDDQNVTDVEGSPSFRNPKKTNSNIEVSLYEEVRTRAYDPKLTNGMTGMILYATLVYFAIRFSFIYIKRYFTIIVLTLMAPGVGIAYAIQKVLTGKSGTFSTWLTEYIMNTIIQVVHAILYAAFVSMALKLALNSVSGMILAFVIMNYMMKAEKLFKKIFKMSSGGGSLLEATDSAGDPEKMKSALKQAQGLAFAAKPIGNALMKSPITKAALAVAKAPVNAGVLGGSLMKKKMDDWQVKDKVKNAVSNAGEKISDGVMGSKLLDKVPPGRGLKKLYKNLYNKHDDKLGIIAQGMEQGGYEEEEREALKAALYTDSRPLKEGETEEQRSKESARRWSEYSRLQKANKIYQKATKQSTWGVATAHVGKLLDYNNYFIPHEGKDGKQKVNPIKDRRRAKWVFDEKTRKPIRLDSLNSLINQQLSAENLLGFNEQNKKQMKQTMQYVGKGLAGVGSMFIGLGTCVAHPNLGMPLLAVGVAQTSKMVGKNKRKINTAKRLRANTYLAEGFEDTQEEVEKPYREERFKFERFNSGAMLTIQAQLQKAYEDDEQAIDEATAKYIMEKHPKLANKIVNGTAKPVSIKNLKYAEISDDKLNSDDVTRLYEKINTRKESVMLDHVFGGIGEEVDKLSLAHHKQIKKQAKKEKQVAIAMISEAMQQEYMQKVEELLAMDETTTESAPESRKTSKQDTEFVPLLKKTRADIASVKDVQSILEVAILEEASKTKKDVTQINIEDGKSRDNIKKTIESILIQKDGMADGQKVEDIIKDFDKEMVSAKTRLDKGSKAKKSKDKKETIKDILKDVTLGENGDEADFIKEITGFDVKASDDENAANYQKAKGKSAESKIPGLSKKEENKVVELLLLQKQMRELNVEAAKLKMSPSESNKRYEAARTFVLNEKSVEQRAKEAMASKRRHPTDNKYYGPVTDIVDLINNL